MRFAGVGALGAPGADVEEEQRGDRVLVGAEIAHEGRYRSGGLVDIGRDRRDPRLDLLGQADPEIESQRLGHLLTEERTERPAAGAPHHLAHGPAEGEAVIAVARAGRPERHLVGQALGHVVPFEGSAVLHRRAQRRHRRGVVQHHAGGHALLAVPAELRPQLDDRRIEVELAVACQHMGAERRGALGAGEHDAHRVLGPGRTGLGIGDPAPQIDDRLAAHGQADRSADLAVAVEVLLEGFGHALEARLAESVGHRAAWFGIGSLKASSRKRAACDNAVSLMPWPTPSAIWRPTLTPFCCSASAARSLSTCGSISSLSPCASSMGGRDLISSFKTSGPASMPEKPTMPASGLARRRPTCSAIIVPCEKPTRQVLLSSSPYSAIFSSRKASTKGAALRTPARVSAGSPRAIANHW